MGACRNAVIRIYARLRLTKAEDAAKEFYNIGFRRRLKKCDQMAKAANIGQLKQLDWKRLHASAGALWKRRNELAHWTVYFGVSSGDIEPGKFGPWLRRGYLDPQHDYNQRRHVGSLKQAAAKFEKLADDLQRFANALPPLPDSLSHSRFFGLV